MRECGICYETKLERLLPCGHSTCHECYDSLRGNTCPYCRTPFREPTLTQQIEENMNDIEFWLQYNPEEWSVYSRYNRSGTETITVFRNGEIPQSWRNDPRATIIRRRRFRRRRLRRR